MFCCKFSGTYVVHLHYAQCSTSNQKPLVQTLLGVSPKKKRGAGSTQTNQTCNSPGGLRFFRHPSSSCTHFSINTNKAENVDGNLTFFGQNHYMLLDLDHNLAK